MSAKRKNVTKPSWSKNVTSSQRTTAKGRGTESGWRSSVSDWKDTSQRRPKGDWSKPSK